MFKANCVGLPILLLLFSLMEYIPKLLYEAEILFFNLFILPLLFEHFPCNILHS